MTRLIKSGLAIASVTALAIPAGASARVARDPSAGGGSLSTSPVTSAPAPAGFQWGDAGIGAAATLVLLSAGLGATVTVRRRPLES